MKLLRFIMEEARSDARTVVILLFFLAPPLSLIGYFIAEAVHGLPEKPADFRTFLGFIVVAVSGFWLTGAVVTRTIALVERVSDRLRRRVLARVQAVEMQAFEGVGQDAVYFALTSHTRRISDATVLAGRAVMSAFGTVACLALLAWISWEALAVVGVALFIVGVVFAVNQIEIARSYDQARRGEQRYFDGMGGLVRGFKELRLNLRKEEAFVQAEITETGAEATLVRQAAGSRLFFNYLLYTILILASAGFCLYLLPLMFPDLAQVAVYAAVIAGLIPLSVLRDLPLLSRAAGAVDGLQGLESRLDAALAATPTAAREMGEEEADAAPAFSRIGLDAVTFDYTDSDGEVTFPVGPLSFEIAAGDICFIIGGNGSGKSTALKLLTGLYPPTSGRVTLDGAPVALGAQRRLFSAVFADFQLFDRLYGYRDTPPEKVREWLELLELSGRVSYRDGKFSDLRLSTGQRKRLALIGCLVEDRPIFAFDEWAADQDPEYREWFYGDFLALLKARRKTVVAITHDDRYFDVADQRVVMDKGRLVD